MNFKEEVRLKDNSPENSQERKKFEEIVYEMIQINRSIAEDLKNFEEKSGDNLISESDLRIAGTIKTRLYNTREKIAGLGLIIETKSSKK